MTLILGMSLVVCHGLWVRGAEFEYGGVGGSHDGSLMVVRGVGGMLRTTYPGGGSALKEFDTSGAVMVGGSLVPRPPPRFYNLSVAVR